ncbi:hypothetical protein CEXT_755631 [Caerostris extrusa]|uniref:Uncharacterized protein n=1 Tax=Caerostris extrusa TaxID=172846 RepID=A0AAV4NRV7_CAEEX|nr:hypothetical protein CEXT_755631 [Caerostris extrusa]
MDWRQISLATYHRDCNFVRQSFRVGNLSFIGWAESILSLLHLNCTFEARVSLIEKGHFGWSISRFYRPISRTIGIWNCTANGENSDLLFDRDMLVAVLKKKGKNGLENALYFYVLNLYRDT